MTMPAVEIVSWATTAIAVTGAVLNNQRRRACFWAWLASNGLSAGIHLHAGLWALACRDMIFFGLAIHGLIAWGRAAGPRPRADRRTRYLSVDEQMQRGLFRNFK